MPSKQLGQNFLIDPNMARWIVSQLEITADDAVVEVGPGTGSLSEHLVGKVRKLILIEFDARLAEALKHRFRDDPSVEVHHADGVKFDGRQLFKHRPLKFLGNLPYSCGGAILKNLLSRPHPFERAVIMLQKEVIDRLGAAPGTKDYGILSLRTQANWEVKSLRTVPPEAFYPQPKIDSSVAVLTPRTSGLPTFDYRLFDELIRRGFAQRRKQLKKQLPEGPQWEDITAGLGVTATRAEVHAQRLTHRAVHVFVFNKRGDLLLQKRSLLKDMCPGLWDSSVSGHLDSGESYETAAIRELEEEMGITTETVPEEIARIAPGVETGWEHVRLYRIRHDGALRFPAAEVDAVMWFPLAEIAAWIAAHPADFAPGFMECWKKFTAL